MKVSHPTLKDVHYDVPEGTAEEWTASGWVVNDPEPDTEPVWDEEPEKTLELIVPMEDEHYGD